MTENLRLGYDASNPNNISIDLTEQDSNISFTSSERTAGKHTLTTYDLVTYGTSGKQCYGTYDSGTGTGSGGGYTTPCIHSGTIVNIDTNTVWYNYALASAGTITGTSNTTTATQSICPKGWTLPNADQIRTIGPNAGSATYVSSFSPVLGGYHRNGTLNGESTYGYWWVNTANNGAARQRLGYNGSILYTGSSNSNRYDGLYIRCIQAS
ncbi:hypothetical protein IKF84_00825, partial [Candidatus Saccharibacteria bacterium]|nr:hypothetical protein [Candidatus Saccharibacteria bacterium]